MSMCLTKCGTLQEVEGHAWHPHNGKQKEVTKEEKREKSVGEETTIQKNGGGGGGWKVKIE